jgi:uncharacterized protein YdbL (DUF1318 family)
MIKRLKHLALAGFFVLGACVTINVYFPAAAIQKAADQIVDEVRGADVPKEQPLSGQKEKGSWLHQGIRGFSLGPSNAYAQLDVDVSTPAGRSLRKAMCDMFPSLRPFYAKGIIGENNMGLIEIRSTEELSLKQTAEIRILVERENHNRNRFYAEIVKANKLGRKSLPQVQQIFANSWRSKSEQNWWIQKDSGEWEKKR